MQKKIIDYTNEILDYIQNIPLSDSTVRYYGCCYRALTDYFTTNCERIFKIRREALFKK